MNNLKIKYRVNEQGMIVEEIEELEGAELEEKVSPQHVRKDVIPEDTAISTSN